MSGIADRQGDHEHGTRARYVAGKCRCEPCRAANTTYARDQYRIRIERRAEVTPSGPPIEGTILRAGRVVPVKLCPGAGGAPCVRSPAGWLRKAGVCSTCARRATTWNGLVPVARAREHMLKLRKAGVGLTAVRDACDVAKNVLLAVLAGKGQLRAQTERRILAVDEGARADRAVAPKRSGRRMRALLKQIEERGFRKGEVGKLLGTSGRSLQLGKAASPLVRSVAAVERLWRRVERGEVKPSPTSLVDSGPVRELVRELLTEEWITEEELARRLGFRLKLTSPSPTMRRDRAEKVTALAAELRRERQEADEREEHAWDLERFALARNAAE